MQYLKGELSNQERNSFERDLEGDPFDREALEELETLTPAQAEEDILSLHTRLRKRLRRRRRIAWYSAAASIASLLIIGTVFLQIYDFNPEVAEETLNEEVFLPSASGEPEKSIAKEISPEKTRTPQEPMKEEIRILEQEAIDEAKSPKGPSKAPENDPSKGPAKGRSNGPAKAAEIQATETPLVEAPDAQAPTAKVVAENIEPEMITYIEAEATLQEKDTQFDYIVSETKAAPMEEEIIEEDTGGRAKRRNEGLNQPAATMPVEMQQKASSQENENQLVSREVSAQSAQPSVGYRAFRQYLENNIQFPEVETTTDRVVVILKFTVTSAGEITDIVPLRSKGEPFTQEAIRLIKEGPSWNPATDDNGHIEEIVRIRIVFKK